MGGFAAWLFFCTCAYAQPYPAGTASAAVHRLDQPAVKGRGKPEAREKIALQGMDPTPSASPPAPEKLIPQSGAKLE